jgi:DNA-binding NarL/FixJ family response regulator
LKILIADDSDIVRTVMTEMVSMLPFVESVVQATDATKAIQEQARSPPDVAILDIRMPGGGGMEALQIMKGADPRLVVIMLTNYPYDEYRRQCMAGGADFFFDKSSEFKSVVDVLRTLQAGAGGERAATPLHKMGAA